MNLMFVYTTETYRSKRTETQMKLEIHETGIDLELKFHDQKRCEPDQFPL